MSTHNHPNTTTASQYPVDVGEDLAGSPGLGSNARPTHAGFPPFFVYCNDWGEISIADHLPADCTELARASRQGEAEHLERIIEATATLTPSGRRYVPGATQCKPDQRPEKFALYAAKLYRETRSQPV